jgi:hypothetical protein
LKANADYLVAVSNITVTQATGAFAINQCTHYSSGGVSGDCDTSKFAIHDITVSGIHGTMSRNSSVASLKCSPAAPCKRLKFENIDAVLEGSGQKPTDYKCLAVEETMGFNCTNALPLGLKRSIGRAYRKLPVRLEAPRPEREPYYKSRLFD